LISLEWAPWFARSKIRGSVRLLGQPATLVAHTHTRRTPLILILPWCRRPDAKSSSSTRHPHLRLADDEPSLRYGQRGMVDRQVSTRCCVRRGLCVWSRGVRARQPTPPWFAGAIESVLRSQRGCGGPGPGQSSSPIEEIVRPPSNPASAHAHGRWRRTSHALKPSLLALLGTPMCPRACAVAALRGEALGSILCSGFLERAARWASRVATGCGWVVVGSRLRQGVAC